MPLRIYFQTEINRMGYRKRKKKCKTSYDRLEGRRLLAGDVLTSVDDGTLFIIGDAQSNIVQLAQDANGNVLITGNDTTVNGQSESVSISDQFSSCLLYTSPSPRDRQKSRMPSSA